MNPTIHKVTVAVTQDWYWYRGQGQKRPKKDGDIRVKIEPVPLREYRKKFKIGLASAKVPTEHSEWTALVAAREIEIDSAGLFALLLLAEDSEALRLDMDTALECLVAPSRLELLDLVLCLHHALFYEP